MEKFIDSRVESLKQQPTEEDAMGFITYVKNFLSVKDDEYKFEELAAALEDYNMLKIRVEDLIEIVHKIFEGHPMLFSGFQKLLPQETTTSIVYCTNRNIYSGSESENQACKEYIETVKTRFENDPDVYYSFLTILDDYGKGEDNVVGVYPKIFDLFLDHEDLVKEFNYFLSDLDDNTREKIKEIKIWTKEDHLSKVQKLLLKVIEERKFLAKVYRFSNLVLENSNIDIDKHLNGKDLKCLEELYSFRDKIFKEELSKDPEKILTIVNPLLKMRGEELSRRFLFKLQFLNENHQDKRPRLG